MATNNPFQVYQLGQPAPAQATPTQLMAQLRAQSLAQPPLPGLDISARTVGEGLGKGLMNMMALRAWGQQRDARAAAMADYSAKMAAAEQSRGLLHTARGEAIGRLLPGLAPIAGLMGDEQQQTVLANIAADPSKAYGNRLGMGVQDQTMAGYGVTPTTFDTQGGITPSNINAFKRATGNDPTTLYDVQDQVLGLESQNIKNQSDKNALTYQPTEFSQKTAQFNQDMTKGQLDIQAKQIENWARSNEAQLKQQLAPYTIDEAMMQGEKAKQEFQHYSAGQKYLSDVMTNGWYKDPNPAVQRELQFGFAMFGLKYPALNTGYTNVTKADKDGKKIYATNKATGQVELFKVTDKGFEPLGATGGPQVPMPQLPGMAAQPQPAANQTVTVPAVAPAATPAPALPGRTGQPKQAPAAKAATPAPAKPKTEAANPLVKSFNSYNDQQKAKRDARHRDNNKRKAQLDAQTAKVKEWANEGVPMVRGLFQADAQRKVDKYNETHPDKPLVLETRKLGKKVFVRAVFKGS